MQNKYHIFILLFFLLTKCSIYDLSANTYINRIFHVSDLSINTIATDELMIVDTFPIEFEINQTIPITNITIQTPNTVYTIDPEIPNMGNQSLTIAQNISPSNNSTFNIANPTYPVSIQMINISNEITVTNINYQIQVQSIHLNIDIPNIVSDENWANAEINIQILDTGASTSTIRRFNIYSSIGNAIDISPNEDFLLSSLGDRDEEDIEITLEIIFASGDTRRITETITNTYWSISVPDSSGTMIVDSFPLSLSIRQAVPIKEVIIQAPNHTYYLEPTYIDNEEIQLLNLEQQIAPSNTVDFNPENPRYSVTVKLINIRDEAIFTNITYNIKVKSSHFNLSTPPIVPEPWNSSTAVFKIIVHETGAPVKNVYFSSTFGNYPNLPYPYIITYGDQLRPTGSIRFEARVTSVHNQYQSMSTNIHQP